MSAEISAGLLTLKQAGNKSTVILVGDGLFESGSAEIDPKAIPLVEKVARDCGVPAERVTLILTPTRSPAGIVQIVARVLEVGLHKLHALHFPLERVVRAARAQHEKREQVRVEKLHFPAVNRRLRPNHLESRCRAKSSSQGGGARYLQSQSTGMPRSAVVATGRPKPLGRQRSQRQT